MAESMYERIWRIMREQHVSYLMAEIVAQREMRFEAEMSERKAKEVRP